MTNSGEKRSGGFHFGNVGGSVSQKAGDDIVGGDKTTTITNGFADDGKKAQFQAQIDQLHEALRALKTEITANKKLNADQKDSIEAVITPHLVAFKEAKEQAATVETGKEASADIVSKVGGALDRAGGVMDRLKSLADKSGDIAEVVGKFALRFGPLLLGVRHLFGLP